MEQQINLKFLVKLRKILIEYFQLLKEVYGEDVMSRTEIFKWHKRFEKSREEVENDSKTGRPSTTRRDENITRVKQLVQSYRRLTVRMISDELRRNSADDLERWSVVILCFVCGQSCFVLPT